MRTTRGTPQKFPELRGKLELCRYPVYVEPKIDGELNWYQYDMDIGPTLVNKSGKIRYSFSLVRELHEMVFPETRLLGELHWDIGKSGDLYEFLKHQNDDELRFTIFDVDMPGPYIERRTWLEHNINPTKHVGLVASEPAINEVDVKKMYKTLIDCGFEGIVVKSADSRLIMGPCPWVKMKRREMWICKVKEISKSKERIEISYSYDMHHCGVKVPNNIKATLQIGDEVEIEHQGELNKGGLRHPVFIRKVEGPIYYNPDDTTPTWSDR